MTGKATETDERNPKDVDEIDSQTKWTKKSCGNKNGVKTWSRFVFNENMHRFTLVDT